MNEGTPLEGPINPTPKRKRPESLLVRFYEIENSGDLGEAINCCFDAGANKVKVEATDYNEAEMALIKITTKDGERFIVGLDDTEFEKMYDVVWRTK